MAQTIYIRTNQDVNRRSLNNHKWFVHQFNEADKKYKNIQQEANRKKIHKCIKSLALLVILYNILYLLNVLGSYSTIILLAMSIGIYESIYGETSDSSFKVFMKFTRPAIFYQNTHYIFIGTKEELAHHFQCQRNEIDAIKKEIGFGRGDHDDLMDMPLDTFCNNLCDCIRRTEPDANYNCSHWNLYSYESDEELNKHVKEIERDVRTGFQNVITYLK